MFIAAGLVAFFTRDYLVDQSFDAQKSFWGFKFSDETRNYYKKRGLPLICALFVLFGILVILGVIKK